MKSKPTAIDLFCGVGGMSLGFEQAGFNVLAAFDKERFNVATHKKNFPRTRAFEVDLAKQTGQSIRELAGAENKEIDVVFGGPPCQGFSIGGRQEKGDERNLLVYEFARLVRQIRPAYFVFENVRGLMFERSTAVRNSLVRRLRLAGYHVVDPIQILNAREFGVPQRRERVFIIGCRKGLAIPEYPLPEGCFDEYGNESFPTVRDAIWDLPKLDGRLKFFSTDEVNPRYKKTVSTYARLMRGDLKAFDDVSSRRQNGLKLLTGCMLTQHSPEIIERFAKTPQGGVDKVSRYMRLSWGDVAPTLRAGTGVERGSHTAPRPIHPASPRCITTREAARLHSFPDWFQFYGTRWHDFRQIGNSVPPMLAKAVAAKIRPLVS